MKVDEHLVPNVSLEDFADEHELVLVVRERRLPEGDPGRFYAFFARTDVVDGGFLMSEYGDGATPGDAIANYIPKISLKRIAVDAFTSLRREIAVPRLRPWAKSGQSAEDARD